MIRNLSQLGVTVFLTTHYMDEAQSLADEVAILVEGRIAAQGPPGILTAGKQTHIRFRLPEGTPRPPAARPRAIPSRFIPIHPPRSCMS